MNDLFDLLLIFIELVIDIIDCSQINRKDNEH
jgi:hypothetical protein